MILINLFIILIFACYINILIFTALLKMRVDRGNSRERSRTKKTEIESSSLFKVFKEEDVTNPNVVLSYQYQFDYGKWLELGLK